MNEPIRPIAPPVDRTVQPVSPPRLTPRERDEEKERRERRRRARRPPRDGGEEPRGGIDVRV